MELTIENGVLERFYSDDTELIIPDGVTKIGYNACFLNTQIKKLVIPEGVTAIDENAFRNCSELSDVVLPDKFICVIFLRFCIYIISYDTYLSSDILHLV